MKVFLKCLSLCVHVLVLLTANLSNATTSDRAEIYGLPAEYKKTVLLDNPEVLDGLSKELAIAYSNNESYITIDGIDGIQRITFVEADDALQAYLSPAQDDLDVGN